MENNPNLRRSQRIMDIEARKRQPDKEDDGKPAKKAKKPAIKIHGDIILKFLKWIPLKSLPNILLTNKRFWLFGNESLDARKHIIYRMNIRSFYQEEDNLALQLIEHGPLTIIEIPEAEPPKNFRLEFSRITTFAGPLDTKTKEFLRFSKDFFIGAKTTFETAINAVDMDEFDDISAILDQFKLIETTMLNPASINRFFANSTVSNCSRLYFWAHSDIGLFDNVGVDSIVNWLHLPLPEWDTTATQRQIYFEEVRYNGNRLPKLFESLKQKFKEDTTKHTFVLRFPSIFRLSESEMDKIENTATDEVLFIRLRDIGYGVFHDFIRCSKDEENTVDYER